MVALDLCTRPLNLHLLLVHNIDTGAHVASVESSLVHNVMLELT